MKINIKMLLFLGFLSLSISVTFGATNDALESTLYEEAAAREEIFQAEAHESEQLQKAKAELKEINTAPNYCYLEEEYRLNQAAKQRDEDQRAQEEAEQTALCDEYNNLRAAATACPESDNDKKERYRLEDAQKEAAEQQMSKKTATSGPITEEQQERPFGQRRPHASAAPAQHRSLEEAQQDNLKWRTNRIREENRRQEENARIVELREKLLQEQYLAEAQKQKEEARKKIENATPNEKLLMAAKNIDLEGVKDAIHKGADVNTQDNIDNQNKELNTALLLICLSEKKIHADFIRACEETSRETDEQGMYLYQMPEDPCFDNHYKIIKYLLDHGAKIGIKNDHGQNPFKVALHACSHQILKLLHAADQRIPTNLETDLWFQADRTQQLFLRDAQREVAENNKLRSRFVINVGNSPEEQEILLKLIKKHPNTELTLIGKNRAQDSSKLSGLLTFPLEVKTIIAEFLGWIRPEKFGVPRQGIPRLRPSENIQTKVVYNFGIARFLERARGAVATIIQQNRTPAPTTPQFAIAEQPASQPALQQRRLLSSTCSIM